MPLAVHMPIRLKRVNNLQEHVADNKLDAENTKEK